MVEKMVGIKDIKENLWAIAILGGIFGAISIFTPAWGLISGGDFYGCLVLEFVLCERRWRHLWLDRY